MPKLVFINKNFEEQEYELRLEKTTVGRGNHNTLVICDSSVSMTHCEILMNGPEIIVHDLGSSNGTFVDGMRLHKGQTQAKSGQVLRFGLVEARLLLEPEMFDDSTTSLTAVVDMQKYQREKRREAKKLMQTNVAGKIEPSADVEMEAHTVLVPCPPQSAPGPVSADTQVEAPKSKKLVILIVVAVLAMALAALLWFVFHFG